MTPEERAAEAFRVGFVCHRDVLAAFIRDAERRGWESALVEVNKAIKKDKRFGGMMRIALLHLTARIAMPDNK